MKAAVALLYAFASTALGAVVLGFATGRISLGVAWLALTLGLLIGGYSLWPRRSDAPSTGARPDVWGVLALVVFALFALRSFLWLVFPAGKDWWVFSPNNLGDFSLHVTYVQYLANGAPFWPENPIFAGAPLTYPVGMDLFNSLLVLAGQDIMRSFVWVGLIGSFCTAAMLWRWGRGFAVAGFLFAGGTFGFEIFRRGGELIDYQSDAAWDGLVVAWKSLPLALFVTQRGLLFALPAGLALLASWRARFLEPGRPDQRLPLWGEWLLYAAMPLFHLHTFLFLSIVAAIWFLGLRNARRHFLILVGLAVVPASALVWCVTGGFHGQGLIGWNPGWMQEKQNFFAFWLMNFGLFLPLCLSLLAELAYRRGPRSMAALAVPGAVVFLLCCLVKFAPWPWDNTKLMIWSYLIVLPALWQVVIAPRAEWIRAFLCFLLFFSGAISLAGGLSGNLVVDSAEERRSRAEPLIGYSVASRLEIDGTAAAVKDLPITDRFIARPNYNHPLLLAGRQLAMGYEGHLWSHGVAYSDRKDTVESILKGEPGWREKAAGLGARWLFWGEQEKAAYPDSKQPWRRQCEGYSTGDWGTIYDLKSVVVE